MLGSKAWTNSLVTPIHLSLCSTLLLNANPFPCVQAILHEGQSPSLKSPVSLKASAESFSPSLSASNKSYEASFWLLLSAWANLFPVTHVDHILGEHFPF